VTHAAVADALGYALSQPNLTLKTAA